jgi:hypothetical protein
LASQEGAFYGKHSLPKLTKFKQLRVIWPVKKAYFTKNTVYPKAHKVQAAKGYLASQESAFYGKHNLPKLTKSKQAFGRSSRRLLWKLVYDGTQKSQPS